MLSHPFSVESGALYSIGMLVLLATYYEAYRLRPVNHENEAWVYVHAEDGMPDTVQNMILPVVVQLSVRGGCGNFPPLNVIS